MTYTQTLAASAETLGIWSDLSFFDNSFGNVVDSLSKEDATTLPPAGEVLAALAAVPCDAVRVVILGQDPYPTPGHAHGFAFSVTPETRPLPRSLNNIFKEMHSDLGQSPTTGDLTGWARQGVLLLNSCLTVRAGEAGSHAKIGWHALTTEVCATLAARDGIVWILWGKHAQGFKPIIEAGTGRDPLIIESVHPSPLSARRGFFGSKPFSRTNAHLKMLGKQPIDWTA